MIWLALVLLILFFFFLLIIFTKLTIVVNYFHHNDDDDLKIQFRVWFGLIKYNIHVPSIKIDDDSPSVVLKSKSKMGSSPAKEKESKHKVHQIDKNDIITNLKNTKELLLRVFQLNVIVRKFFKKVSIKQLEWHTLIGTGDAAQTGVITGVIWGLKGSLLGLLSHYLQLKGMPDLAVTPHFRAAVIQTRLTCIFQFRIGYAILAGLKCIKFWKGGRPHFRSKTNFSKEKTKSV